MDAPAGKRASMDASQQVQQAQQAQQAEQPAVMQVVLSLKVMVAAGTVCAFHIGGGQESADDGASIPVRRGCSVCGLCGVCVHTLHRLLAG